MLGCSAMSKYQRVLIEVLAPAPLALVALLVTSYKQDTLAGILLGFIPGVCAAYVLGFVPSLLYTGAMELWFHLGLRARCGFVCTGILSSLLGAGAGFLSAVLGTGLGFSETDRLFFLRLGALIGLLIGLYVGREQKPKAQPAD
jgi:hypothetical protein